MQILKYMISLCSVYVTFLIIRCLSSCSFIIAVYFTYISYFKYYIIVISSTLLFVILDGAANVQMSSHSFITEQKMSASSFPWRGICPTPHIIEGKCPGDFREGEGRKGERPFPNGIETEHMVNAILVSVVTALINAMLQHDDVPDKFGNEMIVV